VAPDRFEEELLVELMWALATDSEFRERAGTAAREFIEQEHEMRVALSGYKQVIEDVYRLALAAPHPGRIVVEAFPNDDWLQAAVLPAETPAGGEQRAWDVQLSDAMGWLGLGVHDATIERVARRQVELGMDSEAPDLSAKAQVLDEEFVALLACPVCKGVLRQVSSELVCDGCGKRYAVKDGIPDLRVTAK
jgi:hypothetical protein